MTTFVNEIKSANWQIGISGFGNVVEGNEDINQAIGITLLNVKGSDPFRPNFGSNLWDYLDTPINTAIPNMIREITTAVKVWEKRVAITRITHEFIKQDIDMDGVKSGVKFNIFWEAVTGTGNDSLTLIFNPLSAVTPFTVIAIQTENGEGLTTESNELIVI